MPWVSKQTLINHIIQKLKDSKGTLNGVTPTDLQKEIEQYRKQKVSVSQDEVYFGSSINEYVDDDTYEYWLAE